MNDTVKSAWRRAPRLNEFADFFERTASGLEGAPDYGAPIASADLLQFDLDCLTYADTHRRLWGNLSITTLPASPIGWRRSVVLLLQHSGFA